MKRSTNYKHTVRAASIGYIVQALINTFAPLLFITFQNQYAVSLTQLSILIATNFAAQIVVDYIASTVADRIGFRPCVVLAQILAAIGIGGLAFLPELFANPFFGLMMGVIIYGAGGGLTEVLLTPIVQSCPIERKDKAVSMLHAFYCWGSVLIIVASTVFFKAFGIQNWKLLAILWAILPIVNAINFLFVPIYEFVPVDEKMKLKDLAGSGTFWLLFVFMFCAGSSEMAIAQWASTFAESGLHLSKAVGDMAGPCMFCVLKGIERTWYGKKGKEENLWKFMTFCAILSAGCYIVVGLTHSPLLALAFCAVSGFANGVMWPGTFSHAGKLLPKGGTTLFGFLAIAGDLGCGAGPAITGAISAHFNNNLQVGMLVGCCFGLIMVVGLLIMKATQREKM